MGALGVVAAARRDETVVTEQSAVALTPVDGEYITGDTQSNFVGDGYYERNGYTRASDWTGPDPWGGTYTGFDDVDFLPIAAWLVDFESFDLDFYDRMDDLGLNGMLPAHQTVDLTSNITYGKWAFVVAEEHPGGTITTGQDPGVLGVIAGEEPYDTATFEAIYDDNAAWMATSDGAGRMSYINYTDHLLDGGMSGGPDCPELVVSSDLVTCDQYWFAGSTESPVTEGEGYTLYKLAGIYSTLPGGVAVSASQCARGSHYGSMMDCIRDHFGAVEDRRPFFVWIENGAPFSPASSYEITPAQMSWAVWSTLVHGARGITYFNHSFRTGGPNSFNNFNDDYSGGPGVTGTGIYAEARQTNRRALALASVLNSPFDGYFCYGDGLEEEVGFLTAVTSTNTRSVYGGVDASCRWQPVEGRHYIFATTREQSGTTAWPVTFTMVDHGQTTIHPLWGGADITVTRGGVIPVGHCRFTDTFAHAHTYKAYRID